MKALIFMIIGCSLLFSQEVLVDSINQENKKVYKLSYPDSLLTTRLPDIVKIISDFFKLPPEGHVIKLAPMGISNHLDSSRMSLVNVFDPNDSLKAFAPVGFRLPQDVDSDLIIFTTRGKDQPVIRGYATPTEKDSFISTVFLYRHLQDFFRVPGTFYVFVFGKKKLLFVDEIILFSPPDSKN